MHVDHELRLAGEPDAVPRARRFVVASLAGCDPGLVSDAELVVTELVTNAVLHAGQEIRVRVEGDDPRIRLEVYDTSQAAPVRGRDSAEAMTGRGLAVVESLAERWGYEPRDDGKVVWCELLPASLRDAETAARQVPSDAELISSVFGRQDDLHEPELTVDLGEAPTSLLLSVKEHTDSVARELILAALGAASGATTPVPPHLHHLVDTMVNRFARARRSIERQALAASARGEPRTRLVVTLPASAAEFAEAYLAAMDEADTYSQSERLLTPEAPAEHRAMRRWYVGALVSALRSATDSDQVVNAQTFEDYLLSELVSIAHDRSAAESLADRLSHLQQLTAELTQVSEVEAIAEIAVTHAGAAFGAAFATFYRLEGDELHAVRSRGGTEEMMAPWVTLPLSAELPASEAARTGAPIVVPAGSGISDRYPALTMGILRDMSVVCVPLDVGGRCLGVMSLTFPAERDVSGRDEMAFLTSLADACAQAMDRAQALAAAREVNDKLAFLADASVELGASLDYRTTLSNIAHLVVPRLADMCVVSTIGEGQFDHVAVAHVDPTQVRAAEEIQQRLPRSPRDPGGMPNVVRTGISELHPVITDEMVAAGAVDEEHLRMARELGLLSAMIVPLTNGGRTFGAISMFYGESGRRYSESDLVLAEDVGHRAALAIDNARRYHLQTGQLATITQIAEAAQHAILAPVPRRIGPVGLAAAYVSAAREALVGGDLYEVIRTARSLRLVIGDVRGKGLDAIRLATVVLGFFRSNAVEQPTLSDVAQRMDLSLRPYLGDEDFVTALLVEIHDDGRCEVVCCGHPAPLLANATSISVIDCAPAVPMGLGAAPTAVRLTLDPGDRLLLFTDGLIEARDAAGRFADVLKVAAPLSTRPLPTALRDILSRLRKATGADLDDDLALLAAEYRPR